jgi:hypothetical protein
MGDENVITLVDPEVNSEVKSEAAAASQQQRIRSGSLQVAAVL